MSRGQNKIRRHLGKIAARSNNRCHLCGEGFASLAPTHSEKDFKAVQKWKLMRPTVDHIIPESEGGTYERENIRLAHNTCNSRRGNKPLLYYRMFKLFEIKYPFFAVEIPTRQWLKIQRLNHKKTRHKISTEE